MTRNVEKRILALLKWSTDMRRPSYRCRT